MANKLDYPLWHKPEAEVVSSAMPYLYIKGKADTRYYIGGEKRELKF